MLSKWQGLNIQDVYADWAESLGYFTIGAINYGTIISKGNKHPPSQGEFAENCRGYCPPIVRVDESHRITKQSDTLTQDQKLSKLAKLKAMIAKKMVSEENA